MSEFLAMGGYGAYVWTAYGITALFLLILFVWSWFGARAREAELEQMRKLSRAERRAPSIATPSTATLSAGTLDDGGSADQGPSVDVGTAPMSAGDAGSGAS